LLALLAVGWPVESMVVEAEHVLQEVRKIVTARRRSEALTYVCGAWDVAKVFLSEYESGITTALRTVVGMPAEEDANSIMRVGF
jgi:hypothetical protein